MSKQLGNREIMANNIKKHMESSGKLAKDICDALEISPSTFSDWVNGRNYPRIDRIEMLANYFGISKSELVEENTDNYYLDDEVQEIAQEIAKEIAQLNSLLDA